MMKTMKHMRYVLLALVPALLLVSGTARASHRVLLFNKKAMSKILDMWPNFEQVDNDQARGIQDPGGRGIVIQTYLREYLNKLLREQPTPPQFGEGFRILVRDYYHPAGITTFGSRLDTADQVTAFQYLQRRDGRLPVRFAWSTEQATQPIAGVAAAGLYATEGVMWQTIDYNPWLWERGISSEGDWDSVNRGCLKSDLPVKPGVDRHEVKDVLEICPDFSSATTKAIMRGLQAGWRIVGMHDIGSYGIRIFVQQLQKAMKKNPGVLTLDYVRKMRNGFAHGTMVGAVPDVVALEKKYNLYIPINVRRALAVEPTNIRQHYGEPGWKFLAPVKTLLDDGVNVVGEAEEGTPNPQTYFKQFQVYVNREIAKGDNPGRGAPAKAGEGTVYEPNEGVDRVVALKLFTYRSAQFNYAEDKVGSLEVGKFGDFIVTDKDYLKGPDSQIQDNKVIMTVQAGQRVYHDPAYKVAIRHGAAPTVSMK